MSEVIVASALIALREAFEASLIMAILFAILTRTGRHDLKPYAWIGAGVSVVAGAILASSIWLLYGAFPEKELFEAGASYLAATVIISVVVWMARHGQHMPREIEERVTGAVTPLSIVIVSLIIVGREVFETVLFVAPFLLRDLTATIAGLGVGTLIALALSLAIYVMGLRLNLRMFFILTSVLLVFVASGIAGYGTHELIEWLEEEGYDLRPLSLKAYDLGLPPSSPLHHEGSIGGVIAVLFGYSAYMEWGRVFIQAIFLVGGLLFVLRAYNIVRL